MDKKSFKSKQFSNGNKKKNMKSAGFLALITLIVLIGLAFSGQSNGGLKEVSFSDVISRANKGEVKQIIIKGNTLEVTPKGKDKATEKSNKEAGSSIYEQGLTNRNVDVKIQQESATNGFWLNLLSGIVPVLFISAVLFFVLRSAQGQGNQAMSFGKSKARLYGNEKDKVTFADIAGSDEAKVDLQEVVEFLKFPKKFESVGAKI